MSERASLIQLRFIIPNRDDPEQPPTLYQEWGANAVPREGETVYVNETPWIVKWVAHHFHDDDPYVIEVRLIEPDHWTQRG